MKRLFLLNLFTFFIGFGLFAQTAIPPAGSGTDTDPYLIETWENLYWIAADDTEVSSPNRVARWSAYYVQTANIVFPSDGTDAIQNWDGGAGWTPIGNGTASESGNQVTIIGGFAFRGDYNGQYYTISGLYINRPLANNQGLFGHVGFSSTVEDVNTNIYNVRLEDVHVVGSRAVGSLVGRVTGNENVRIERTSAVGTVTGTAVVGGLVGGNNGNRFSPGLDDTTNPVVSQSWADVDVYYSGLEGTPTEKFGGLVGCSQKGTILDSYARGNVTVIATDWPVERVGGLVGCLEQRGRVERVFSTGLVTTEGDVTLVGGLVGNLGGTGSGNTGVVVDSYWDTETSERLTSAGGANATGGTTAQMTYPYDGSFFVTWDFAGVWGEDISGEGNDGYPYLQWQDIDPSAAVALAFVQQPTNTVAGENITPEVTVEVLGSSGSRLTTYSGVIEIEFDNDPTSGIAELLGTLTASAVNGLATFTLSIEVAAEGYTLRAIDEDGLLDEAISDPFDITAAAPSAGDSSVTAAPLEVIANGVDASVITISLVDAFGNPVIGLTDLDFNLDVGPNATAGSFSAVGNGTYTYSVTNTVAENVMVIVNADGIVLSDQPEITFIPGPVSAGESVVVATTPHTAGVEVSTVTITLQDAEGNRITGKVDEDFTLSLTGSAEVVTGSFADVGNGVYTYQVENEVAETVNVTVSVSDNGSPVELEDNPEIVFEAGDASQLIIDGFSLSQLRNVTFNVTVTLADAFGNPVVNSGENTLTLTSTKTSAGGELGELRFVSDDPGTAPTALLEDGESSVVFSDLIYTGLSDPDDFPDIQINGEATGPGSADGLLGESDLFAVRETRLSIEADPVSIEADGISTSLITVRFEDFADPDNPEGIGNKSLTLTTDKGTLDGGETELLLTTDANGVVTATLTSSTTAGVATVSAVCPGACIVSTEVTFTPGDVNAGNSSVAASTPHTADGVDFSLLTIVLRDVNDNPITDLVEGDFDLDITGSASEVASSFDAVGNGTYTFQVTNTVAETISIMVTAGGVLLNQNPEVEFLPGPVSALNSFAEATTPHTADGSDSSTLTIVLRDANNNPIINFVSGDFDIDITGSAVAGGFDAVGNGTYTYSVTNTVAETVIITVTADGVELNEKPEVVFEAGPVDASESQVIASSPHIAGEEVSTVTVTLSDAQGNRISGVDEVDFDVDLSGDADLVAGSFDEIGDGVYTFEIENDVAETVSVTVTVNSTELDSKPEVVFLPGAPAKLVFDEEPTDAAAGDIITPAVVVHILDANDNLVTSATNSVLLQLGDPSSGATLFGTTGQAAVGGVATFTDLYLEKVGTYTLTASGIVGVVSATSAEFTITAASASQLAFVEQPTETVAGVSIDPAVTVQILDEFGNLVTGATNTVEIALNNANGAVLSGTSSQAAVNGVATFGDLSVNLIGTYSLTASAADLVDDTSDDFIITFGAVSASESSADAESYRLAGGWDVSILTIILKDDFENTISGLVSGDFDFDKEGISADAVEIGGFTEVGDGEYTFEVTSLQAGILTLTVTVTKGDDDEVTLDDQPAIEFRNVFSGPAFTGPVNNADTGACTYTVGEELEPGIDDRFLFGDLGDFDDGFIPQNFDTDIITLRNGEWLPFLIRLDHLELTLSGATEGTVVIFPAGDEETVSPVELNFGTTTFTWVAIDIDGNTATHTYSVTFVPTSLRGVVEYYKFEDGASFPMADVVVKLLDASDGYSTIQETTTDASGEYFFGTLSETFNYEDYVMEVSTSLPHGGIASVDALAVLRRVVDLPVTYWDPPYFMAHVGNVTDLDESTFPPGNPAYSDNARRILQRVVNPSGVSFDAGDWAFYSPLHDAMFDNENSNTSRFYGLTCQIWARAYGDVRGQYPDPSKATGNLQVLNDDVVYVEPGEEFTLPLRVTHNLEFNAMTLIMQYDEGKAEVLDIQADMPGMLYSIQDGTIRVSFASLNNTQYYVKGDALIEINLRTVSEVHGDDELFTISSLTEFADEKANLISWFELAISNVDNTGEVPVNVVDVGDAGLRFEAYPNPFRSELNLVFELQESADVEISVMNAQGARIAVISNESFFSGRHQLLLDANEYGVQPGVYFISIRIKGANHTHHEVKRVIYM